MNWAKDILYYSRKEYASVKSYKRQYFQNKERNVRFYNWWNEPYEQLWLYRFVRHRNLVPDDKVLNFISVFGKKEVVNHITDGPIVFFTGENVHAQEHSAYADYLISDKKAGLALGFDWIEEKHYLRFPLWIPFLFDPTADEEALRKRCEELRLPHFGERQKFAALVARYDWNGTRSQIYNALKHISSISCPSSVKHNDDDLKTLFGDDKKQYLKQFCFNICPENSNSYGYVTEKAFEAIDAGCIPIYWGSYDMPELGVLNQDAIIHWNMCGDNTKSVGLVEDLYSHPNRLLEFASQPRLVSDAEDHICGMVDKLSEKLSHLF